MKAGGTRAGGTETEEEKNIQSSGKPLRGRPPKKQNMNITVVEQLHSKASQPVQSVAPALLLHQRVTWSRDFR